MKHLINMVAVAAALILAACQAYEPVAHSVSSNQAPVTACVIGGLGYPITSPVGGITADLRARGVYVLEAGPGSWPDVSFCNIIIGHSLGVDAALKAPHGKRLIISVDAFTHRYCPEGATVIDIYNSNHSFPTTGPLACARRSIAINSGFGLAGHINAPIAAQPTVIAIVDEYLIASARPPVSLPSDGPMQASQERPVEPSAVLLNIR